MPRFSQQFLDELTARADLAQVVSRYTQLTSRGDRLWALCPFHGEKTASFTVNPEKQLYYCFGCGKGGGVVQFVMDMERLEFKEAVEFLAEMYNMELPQDESEKLVSVRKRILEANRLAARFYFDQLAAQRSREAVEYVKKRALSAATVRKFGIGYAPDAWDALTKHLKGRGFAEHELVEAGLAKKGERSVYDTFRNRLMFPIIDVKGNVIGFGGRVLSGESKGQKYLNTGNTPVFYKKSNLYAYQLAKKSGSGKIILAEGYMDVVSLHQAGFGYAVASLGTALTEEQARMLAKAADEIVIAYDTDAAGAAATERAVKVLSQVTDKTVRILRVPGGKDPDEFIRANGAEAFARVLERSEEQMEFRLAALKAGADLKNDEERIAYIRKAALLLSEEDLIALVAERPALAREAAARVKREDFTSEELAGIFFKLLQKIQSDENFNVNLFNSELDDGSVRLLSRILAANRPHVNPERELADLCGLLSRRRLLAEGGETENGQDPLERIVQMKSRPRDGG